MGKIISGMASNSEFYRPGTSVSGQAEVGDVACAAHVVGCYTHMQLLLAVSYTDFVGGAGGWW